MCGGKGRDAMKCYFAPLLGAVVEILKDCSDHCRIFIQRTK